MQQSRPKSFCTLPAKHVLSPVCAQEPGSVNMRDDHHCTALMHAAWHGASDLAGACESIVRLGCECEMLW